MSGSPQPRMLQGEILNLSRDGAYSRMIVACEACTPAEPGQFYMIGPGRVEDPPADPLLLRPISVLAQAPGELHFLIKAQGRVTAWMTSAGAGTPLRLLGPLGRPFSREASPQPVLVGGGVGLPPLHFLSRELSAAGLKHRLLLGFNSAEEIPGELLDELEAPVEIATLDGSRGHRGNPVELLAGDRAPARIQACGPGSMMEALRAAAREDDRLELSLEEHMACGVGICRSCVTPVRDGEGWRYARVCREGPVFDAGELWTGPLDEEDGRG